MGSLSLFRALGLLMAVLGLAGLLRRRGRMLERWEVGAALGLLAVAALALDPELADWVPRLTGFTGELRRIVSLLSVAVLFLLGWALVLQGELAATRSALWRQLREQTARGLQGRDEAEELPQLLLLMPALNEAENLGELLVRGPKVVLGLRTQVLVIDDGSEDTTAEVALAHGAWVASSPINGGGGYALQVGYAVAQRLKIPLVVTLDADGQHRFEDLPGLVAPLISGDADVVIGSRRLGASVGHEPVRSVGVTVLSAVISFIVGKTITDCSSGYRAFTREALTKLSLVQLRHHTAETIIEAARRGLRLMEAPVVIGPRRHGQSKKGMTLTYGARFVKTILATWWKR